MSKRVALYLRVSTSEQTTKNQRRELMTVAKRQGWNVIHVFEDAGVSGAKGRDQRPGLDAMIKCMTKGQVDLVAVWSVDRLGRSLQDLISLLEEFRATTTGLYLHQQGLDTTTPAGRAMFQFMGIFAEFERAMMRERIKAGLARARAEGKVFGRPRVSEKVEAAIRAARRKGTGIRRIARELGVGVSTVQRVTGKLPVGRMTGRT